MTSPKDPPSTLDILQALLLITKHLDILLPFLLSLRRIPADDVRRLGLLQTMARELAENHEAVIDWYQALELLTNDNIEGLSVAQLLKISVDLLKPKAIADFWHAAFSINLIDEEMVQQWILFEGIVDGRSSPDRTR